MNVTDRHPRKWYHIHLSDNKMYKNDINEVRINFRGNTRLLHWIKNIDLSLWKWGVPLIKSIWVHWQVCLFYLILERIETKSVLKDVSIWNELGTIAVNTQHIWLNSTTEIFFHHFGNDKILILPSWDKTLHSVEGLSFGKHRNRFNPWYYSIPPPQ